MSKMSKENMNGKTRIISSGSVVCYSNNYSEDGVSIAICENYGYIGSYIKQDDNGLLTAFVADCVDVEVLDEVMDIVLDVIEADEHSSYALMDLPEVTGLLKNAFV